MLILRILYVYKFSLNLDTKNENFGVEVFSRIYFIGKVFILKIKPYKKKEHSNRSKLTII